MKGIIFNLLEEIVEDEGGAEAWDGLLSAADVDGGYSAIGDYPTSELGLLVTERATQTGTSVDDVVISFGHGALLRLADGFPQFFTPHQRTTDFLLTLNDVIHPQVRKLHAAATPPEFDFTVLGEDEMRIVYHSRRELCRMAEGMIAGAATWYGQGSQITHEACVRTGDADCVLHCTFGADSRDATSGD